MDISRIRKGLKGIRKDLKGILQLLRKALRIFRQNDPLRMAGATAFFAGFAIPPIMIILIQVFSIFWNPRAISHGLFVQMSHVIDPKTVQQIRLILHNVHYLSLNPGARLAVFIFLLFVASTLFEVVKSSMNQLWQIRLKERSGIVAVLAYRLKSIGIIVVAGLLFLIVLLGDTTGWLLQKFIYHAMSLLAIVIWFVVVLKYLADSRPAWKVAIGGGVFTGVLFALGVWLLRWLLSFSKAETIYGASTALTLLLLFVFYSALIFYYGTSFTRALAERLTLPITPTAHHGSADHQSTLPSSEVDGRQPRPDSDPGPEADSKLGSK